MAKFVYFFLAILSIGVEIAFTVPAISSDTAALGYRIKREANPADNISLGRLGNKDDIEERKVCIEGLDMCNDISTCNDGKCEVAWWFWLIIALIVAMVISCIISTICCPCCCLYKLVRSLCKGLTCCCRS